MQNRGHRDKVRFERMKSRGLGVLSVRSDLQDPVVTFSPIRLLSLTAACQPFHCTVLVLLYLQLWEGNLVLLYLLSYNVGVVACLDFKGAVVGP